MPVDAGTVLFASACFVALCVGLVSYRRRKRRFRALLQYAREMDLRFQPRYSGEMSERLVGMPLFARGHCRRAYDVLIGTKKGEPLNLFGWEYEVGFGQNHEVRTWTVAVLDVRQAIPSGWVAPSKMDGTEWLDAIPDNAERLLECDGYSIYAETGEEEITEQLASRLEGFEWPSEYCLGAYRHWLVVTLADYPDTGALDKAYTLLCSIRERLNVSECTEQ